MNFSKQSEYDSSFPTEEVQNGDAVSACNDRRAICPSRAMVLTNAGMIPQSVREAVPVGTEMTADVKVSTESMNSNARSSRSF